MERNGFIHLKKYLRHERISKKGFGIFHKKQFELQSPFLK
jgi:hypothetical protein